MSTHVVVLNIGKVFAHFCNLVHPGNEVGTIALQGARLLHSTEILSLYKETEGLIE